MSAEGDLAEGLFELVQAPIKKHLSIYATVVKDSINLTLLTCDVKPNDNSANIMGVNIIADQTDGFILIPKEESVVVVNMFDKDNAYISMFSEIDKVKLKIGSQTLDIDENGFIFNGGNFDGLVKVGPLVQKINKLENEINKLKQIFTSWAPVPNDGGLALKTEILLQTWNSTPITPITQQSDLENDKIKHGG